MPGHRYLAQDEQADHGLLRTFDPAMRGTEVENGLPNVET